jgi:hypothetical protein
MNGQVVNYRVEGAKYGIGFGTALAIAISYTNNHLVLWAIIHLALCDLLRTVQVDRDGVSFVSRDNCRSPALRLNDKPR